MRIVKKAENEDEKEIVNEQEIKTSQRTRKIPTRLQDYVLLTFEEAISDPKKKIGN